MSAILATAYHVVLIGPHGERDYLEKLLEGGCPCVGGTCKDYAAIYCKPHAEKIAADLRRNWLNPHVAVELEAVDA